jgi:hypothetical protein
LRRPIVHRRPNVDPSEGRGCCCASTRSQQRRSWSSPLRRRRYLYLAATLLGLPPPSTTSTTTTTSTSATLASKGYHLHVVLAGFCSSHSICAITTLQLRGDVSSSDSTFDLFSSLTVCGAPAVTAGDVRVYLIGYIFCIIDCHICQDIFGRIDIMYCKLPYVSRDVLLLKTLVLYIYRPRGTIQYNKQLYTIYSSYRQEFHNQNPVRS